MKRIRVIGFIIGLLMPVALWAQTPTIAVISMSEVSVGEQFKIAFEANADGKNFTAPRFDGFTVVGGPFNSTSSSVQVINGSMSRTVKNTYSYVLRAESEGEFTIGSASMVVDGETVKSAQGKFLADVVSCDPEKFDEVYDAGVQDILNSGAQAMIDEFRAAYQAGNYRGVFPGDL